MIRYTKGDILEADAEALVNTVNCVGVMGRGVALQFKNAFPGNFRANAVGSSRPARTSRPRAVTLSRSLKRLPGRCSSVAQPISPDKLAISRSTSFTARTRRRS